MMVIGFGDAAASVLGIADDFYGGFVKLESADGSAITIEASVKLTVMDPQRWYKI